MLDFVPESLGDIEDARYRIFNPEKYVLEKKDHACFHYKDGKLLYRKRDAGFTIDFTNFSYDDSHDYDDLIIIPDDKSSEIKIRKSMFDDIAKLKSSLNKERALFIFKEPLRLFEYPRHLRIKPDLPTRELWFTDISFTNPAFKLNADGGIVHSNYYKRLPLEARIAIKKMSQYLVEKTLGTSEEIMHEALD